MRARARQLGVVGLAIATGLGCGCGSFSAADDASGADGGVDAGLGSVEGGMADGSGQKLVVHGFSKAFVQPSPDGGVLNMQRPIGAEKNDVLLLVVGASSVNTDLSTFSGGFTDRKGVCNNVNKNYLGFTTRTDDETASFDLPFSAGGDALTALLVALGGVRSPFDFKLTNSDSAGGVNAFGSAEPVNIPTETGLVVVGFLSDDGRQQGDGRGAGLEEIASVTFYGRGELKLYGGTFPRGKTGTFGPFTPTPPCWGALAIAFPSTP